MLLQSNYNHSWDTYKKARAHKCKCSQESMCLYTLKKWNSGSVCSHRFLQKAVSMCCSHIPTRKSFSSLLLDSSLAEVPRRSLALRICLRDCRCSANLVCYANFRSVRMPICLPCVMRVLLCCPARAHPGPHASDKDSAAHDVHAGPVRVLCTANASHVCGSKAYELSPEASYDIILPPDTDTDVQNLAGSTKALSNGSFQKIHHNYKGHIDLAYTWWDPPFATYPIQVNSYEGRPSLHLRA